jgi:hypothetical protein
MNTIEEVIEKLDSIVMECRFSSNRLGYFAILYRQVNVRVMEGVKSNEFDDGPTQPYYQEKLNTSLFFSTYVFKINFFS